MNDTLVYADDTPDPPPPAELQDDADKPVVTITRSNSGTQPMTAAAPPPAAPPSDPGRNANGRNWSRAHASPCPSGELRCVDGRCITLAQLCDGTIDCSDHADEDNCYT